MLGGTAVVTFYRGRPDGDPLPDGTSSRLALRVRGTYRVVHVFFVSRIVVASKTFCSCRSGNGL